MIKSLQSKYILMALFAIGMIACEEVIDVDLDSVSKVVVAESSIEPGEVAKLQLSYTSDYFSDDDITYITNSSVYITTGDGKFDTLSYEGNGEYKGKNIIGQVNTSYIMLLYIRNKVYKATSTLLPAPDIESVWFEEIDNNIFDDDDEAKYRIHVAISNDTEQENSYYLFRFYINGEREDGWYALANSSYYPDEDYLEYNTARIDFEKNDQVEVYVYRINEDTYNYYKQLNDLYESGQIISSTTYNPTSNFGDGILGFFSAWSYNSYETTVQE